MSFIGGMNGSMRYRIIYSTEGENSSPRLFLDDRQLLVGITGKRCLSMFEDDGDFLHVILTTRERTGRKNDKDVDHSQEGADATS